MPASHCGVSAPCVILALCVCSCARGSHDVEGSPFGLVAPIASPAETPIDGATSRAPPETAAGPPATTATAVDAGDDDDAVYVVTQDDADRPPDETPDTGGDDAVDEPALADPALPSPGDLAITEVMLSPSGPEPDSEWFEVYNLASSSRLLGGLTIQDGYGDTQVIASSPPVVVPAGAYALLVRDPAAAMQAFLPPAAIVYAYGAGLAWYEGIELDDGTAGDLSLWQGDTLLADVPYGMWDASWIGQSIELAMPSSDASDPGQWCLAQSPWANGSDDGTPGAASDCGR
jgi:hypothetical protein